MVVVTKSLFRGLLMAGVLAVAATFIADHYGGPQMLYALLFGIAFNFLSEDEKCRRGIEFASNQLLRVGVALLGARLSILQLQELGVVPLAVIVCAVFLTIAFGSLLAKPLKLSKEFALLSASSVAVCGASAALAVSSVLPNKKEREQMTILVVAVVTALSTLAMILYPLLVSFLGLDNREAALFLGGTIHDVAQVVGAGHIVSDSVGESSTYIKLCRVTLLTPVVALVALLTRGRGEKRQGALQIPWFLIAFFLFMGVNSLGLLGESLRLSMSVFSRWALVTAIAALGMKTSLKAIVDAGWRPILLLVCETVFLAVFVLLAIALS